MHQDDVWQVFSQNGEPVERKGWNIKEQGRHPRREDGVYLGGAVVMPFRKNALGGIELLWQKRALGIANGGLWDFAAGGHVNLDESFAEAAVREAFEEIGVKIAKSELCFVAVRSLPEMLFRAVFLVDWTGRQDEFHFDDGEVSEVRWVPLAEAKEFRENFAKPAVKNDEATFRIIEEWFRDHGLI